MRLVRCALIAVSLMWVTQISAGYSVAADQVDGGTYRPASKPQMIYVADFDIDVADIREDDGILKDRGRLRGGRILGGQGPLQRHQDAETTAAGLVDLLADSLTGELTKRNLPATRVDAVHSLPRKGWIVRGQFVQVDEGNRVRRAVVGFGSGATDMQIEVEVSDLASYPEEPFLVMGTHTGSGRKPGAVVTLNPYVAAAKFVLSGNASEKDVKNAASEIASELTGYMKSNGLLAP